MVARRLLGGRPPTTPVVMTHGLEARPLRVIEAVGRGGQTARAVRLTFVEAAVYKRGTFPPFLGKAQTEG
jgi:hypothetical protein